MKASYVIPLFLCPLIRVICQEFNVSIESPFLLKNDLQGISIIDCDIWGFYWVSFLDGTTRKYTPTMSSYVNLTLTGPIQKFNHFRFVQSGISLSNGTIYGISWEIMSILSKNRTRIQNYHYANMSLIETYDIGVEILSFKGFPINYLTNVNHFSIIICHDAVRFSFKQAVYIFSLFNVSIGPQISLLTASFESYYYNYATTDNIRFRYQYYCSFSNRQFYMMNVSFLFVFNYSTSSFDLTNHSVFYQLILNTPYTVQTMMKINNSLIFQNNATGWLGLFNIVSALMGFVDTAIPRNQLRQVIAKYSKYYLLLSKGLYKVKLNTTNNSLTLISISATLPQKPYSLTLSQYIASSFDILYIPYEPYIYKSRLCLGQSSEKNAASCYNYNCSVLNCQSCSIVSSICGTCITGYTRNQDYTCSLDNATNSNTSSNDSTSFNSLESYFYDLNEMMPFYKNLLEILLRLISELISIPGARKALPIFYYFGNFDDLYSYQFHNRTYGEVMSNLFEQISIIEDKKWSLIDYSTLFEAMGWNASEYQASTDYQIGYFTEGRSTNTPSNEGLYANTSNFFVVSVPFLIIAFIICRKVFYSLFNFKVSVLFRRFSIWTYLFLLLFEGNIQQFTFYLSAEDIIFFFTFPEKLIKTSCLLFGFSVLVFSCGFSLISYSFYRQMNSLVMDNIRNSFGGLLCFCMQTGLRNFIFGMLHSFLRRLDYFAMMGILIAVEVLFALMFIIALSMRIYKSKYKTWLYIVQTILRVLLILILLIDYSAMNVFVVEVVQFYIVFLMILLFCIGIVTQIVEFSLKYVQFLQSQSESVSSDFSMVKQSFKGTTVKERYESNDRKTQSAKTNQQYMKKYLASVDSKPVRKPKLRYKLVQINQSK